MLGYPFALLSRKPATVLGAFLLFVAFTMGLDILFAALGQDLLSANADLGGEQRLAFQVWSTLSNLFALGIAAWVMGAALVDLKRREPERRPSLLEGAQFFVLNLKFGAMILAPFGGVMALVFVAAGYFFPLDTYWWLGPAILGLPIALAFAYVATRLYLAWARALAVDDIHLLRAWPLTKSKFWLTLGLVLAAHVAAFTPFMGYSFLTELFDLYIYFPIDTLAAALTPEALGVSAAFNVATAFSTVYLAATPAFMLDAFEPVEPDFSETFT